MSYILHDQERLGKFDSNRHEGNFLGYSFNSRAYHSHNLTTKTVMQSVNIIVNDAACSHDNTDGVDDLLEDALPD